MKRNLRLLMFSGTVFAFAACDNILGGTISPNPERTGAYKVRAAMCDKLDACNPTFDQSSCSAALGSSSAIAQKLMSESTRTSAKTVVGLMEAEEKNSLSSNAQAVSACVSQIEALSCTSEAVTSAWNDDRPADFSRAISLIPADSKDCSDIY